MHLAVCPWPLVSSYYEATPVVFCFVGCGWLSHILRCTLSAVVHTAIPAGSSAAGFCVLACAKDVVNEPKLIDLTTLTESCHGFGH